MKKEVILITGIAGLLGSRLADWIIQNHPDLIIWHSWELLVSLVAWPG
jgi:nucleoside-diphosphate-sugar epimerase